MDLSAHVLSVIETRGLAGPDTPVVLMVSGGSDSTALAYLCADLRRQGKLGPLAMLHVNHRLRGDDADGDEAFARQLAEVLEIPFTCLSVDVRAISDEEGGNVEAVARRLRYQGAHEALAALCQQHAVPVADGRIFVAHTADDRIENFFMRSIVGTGPGGFRSMRYLNGQVGRPLLDLGRDDLRAYIDDLAEAGRAMGRGPAGELWCEDATNSHTDRFRAFVRHQIVPKAKERNPQLLATLTRTMNLMADEDDMLEAMVDDLQQRFARWLCDEGSGKDDRRCPEGIEGGAPDASEGFLLLPELGEQPLPLQRRLADRLLQAMLGPDARVEFVSVQAVLDGWRPRAAGEETASVNSGYVANIQGNLAVSANKHGVRVEPMAAFRARRKRA